MFSIDGTTITLIRGDTLITRVGITDASGNEYIPQEGDSLRFALKRDYNDTNPLILKEIPIDTRILRLDPADTKPLGQPDTYVYDVEITYGDGFVDTFIRGKLKLKEEVY